MELRDGPLINDEVLLCDHPKVLNNSALTFDCGVGPVAEPFGPQCRGVGEIPGEANGRIRFVAIGGKVGSPLGNYVRAVFGPVDIHSVNCDDLRGFSSQLGSYSVLVVLTDDAQRTKRMLRKVKTLTQNKLVYAIMSESTPQSRAALMRLVFDDVFDLRSRPQEILVRIGSHWQRQQEYDLNTKDEARFAAFCEENLTGPVHTLQAPVLKLLFDNLGEKVRYRDLAAYDFHSGEFRTEPLTVRIHHLHRKLKNYEIRCKRGVGYVLVKLDEQAAASRRAKASA